MSIAGGRDLERFSPTEAASAGVAGIPYVSATPVVSTTTGTKVVELSAHRHFDVGEPIQPGDSVILAGTTAADGTYTVDTLDPANGFKFTVLESINTSTGGTADFYHPSGASQVGVDPTGFGNSAAIQTQQMLADLDAAIAAGGITGVGLDKKLTVFTGPNTVAHYILLHYNNTLNFFGVGTANPAARVHARATGAETGVVTGRFQGAVGHTVDILDVRDGAGNRLLGFGLGEDSIIEFGANPGCYFRGVSGDIRVSIGGLERWRFTAAAIGYLGTGRSEFLNVPPSTTTPVSTFAGHNASGRSPTGTDQLSDICGNLEISRLTVNGIQAMRRLFQTKGADVASAATPTLGSGNTYDITGTTGIANITTTDWPEGSEIILRFDGIVVVTHGAGGAGQILLERGQNLTTAAGTVLKLFRHDTTWVENTSGAGLIRVIAADTQADYLDAKIVTTGDLNSTVQDAAGVRTLEIGVEVGTLFAADQIQSTALASTTLLTAQDAFAAASISPSIAGDYLVFFDASAKVTNANGTMEIGVSKNGTGDGDIIAGSLRPYEGNQIGSSIAVIRASGLIDTDTIHGIFRKSVGSGTAELRNRSIALFRISA